MVLVPVQDQRPRDWAYMAVFKEKDLPSLQEMAKHIRETHDIGMIEDFNAKCEQKLAGEKAVLNNDLEIEQVTKTGDLVVNSGLQLCLNIILGTSSARFSHFGLAIGNTTPVPAITDTALTGETVTCRVPLAWSEPVGMRLYFGGISSQTDSTDAGAVAPFAPGSVGEIGVYNSAIAGATLLNRSLFIYDARTQDTTSLGDMSTAPIVVSSVIEFCPVT